VYFKKFTHDPLHSYRAAASMIETSHDTATLFGIPYLATIFQSYNQIILITIGVSKMTKVTSQARYKKNIEIKEKKKKINKSSDNV